MEKILLISHASAGFIALISGIIAMLSPKKLKLHKPAGKVFYFAMWYVIVTAFTLSYLKTNLFLMVVGTLTFYTNITGYRALKLYQSKSPMFNFKDIATWFITLIMIIGIQSMIVYKYGFRFDGAFIVIHVFTILLFGNLIQDINMYFKKPSRKDFLLEHIGKMGGTFIAAITAALVQNVQTEPIWVAWFLPAVLVSPVIAYFSRSVKSGKFWQKRAKTSLTK